MRLSQFVFLKSLKQHGSFSKASQSLLVSQPSLSTAIKELEDELGVLLLKRTKQGVIFTSIGELVLEKIEKILNEVDNIKKITTNSSNLPGSLLIGSIPCLCGQILFNTIMNIEKNHPLLSVQVDEGDYLDIIKEVGNNKYDLGIIGVSVTEDTYISQILTDHDILFQPLHEDELCFWVGSDHPLRTKQIVAISDFKGCPFIAYKKNLTKQDVFTFDKYGMSLDKTVYTNDIYSLKNYLMISKGAFTLAPYSVYAHDIYSTQGFLYPLKIKDFNWKITYGLISKKQKFNKLEKELFVGELIKSFAMLGV